MGNDTEHSTVTGGVPPGTVAEQIADPPARLNTTWPPLGRVVLEVTVALNVSDVAWITASGLTVVSAGATVRATPVGVKLPKLLLMVDETAPEPLTGGLFAGGDPGVKMATICWPLSAMTPWVDGEQETDVVGAVAVNDTEHKGLPPAALKATEPP